MRCTQIFGLSKDALAFLEKNCHKIPSIKCPKCGEVITWELDKRLCGSARDYGMFGDGPELYEYHLKSRKIVREVVQNCVLSSGPCIFLCLKDSKGKKLYRWPKKVIEEC